MLFLNKVKKSFSIYIILIILPVVSYFIIMLHIVVVKLIIILFILNLCNKSFFKLTNQYIRIYILSIYLYIYLVYWQIPFIYLIKFNIFLYI